MITLIHLSILSFLLSWLMPDVPKTELVIPSETETACMCDPESDRQALIALYNATGGENWARNDNWLSDQPLSNWNGITTNVEGCVIEIYLGTNNLSGSIVSEIGNLQNLISLNLDRNELNGFIPTEIGNLQNLEEFSIISNQLSGSIPKEIGDLQNIVFLSLGDNQLSGFIPPELGSLQNLGWLQISNNNLSGRIPPELGNLQNLVILSISHNELTGTIPVEFSNCENLWALAISNNNLTGTIPVEFGNLTNIRDFSCSNNNFSGGIPEELSNIQNLRNFDISNNSFIGGIPSEFRRLWNLGNFNFSNNNLSGCFPQEIQHYCDIAEPDFTNNPQLPWQGDFQRYCNGEEQIGAACDDNNPTTENDQIQADCSCAGTVLSTCSTQDSLILVDLYNSTEGIRWRNTWDLNQPMNTWYGLRLNQDGCVTHLSLADNNLLGELPTSMGNLSNLIELELHLNEINGSIPMELGSLSNLTLLNLGANDLRGNIPPELGNLINLMTLYLYENGLSGSIPAELGDLANLFALSLGTNGLTGAIPPELGKLSNLSALDLRNNDLSDCFPEEIFVHCNISYDFSNNPDLPNQGDFSVFCNSGTGICETITSCGLRDSLILVELYNATDGMNWTRNDNWLSNQPIEDWFGITTNDEGCVTRLQLCQNCYVNTAADRVGNNLVGMLPNSLGDLSELERIILIKNEQLEGNIPNTMGELDSLTRLDLWNNNLEGSIPPELGDLLILRHCYLGNNNLTGTIPNTLGQLDSLTRLSIAVNSLTGTIPTELGNLSNLGWLSLWGNNLEGTIPSELGDLTNLTVLSLGDNQLSGEIPSELGNLTNLTQLSLFKNSLSGSIPPELNNLSNLSRLYLNDNQLEGCFTFDVNTICPLVFNEDYDDFNINQTDTIYFYAQDGYSLTNNPQLPWQGDFQRYCNGEEQVGAACDDGSPNTQNDQIQADCSCAGTILNTETVCDTLTRNLYLSTSNESCYQQDASIQLNINSGNLTDYTVSWSTGTQNMSQITQLATGSYTVTISNDACSIELDAIVGFNNTAVADFEVSLGGTANDRGYIIRNTTDGGYIISGYTNSSDGDVGANNGNDDYWLVKLNPAGGLEWSRTIGGSGRDRGRGMQQTTDGGYVITGYTQSIEYSVTGANTDGDIWTVKLDSQGNIEWEKSYGGTEFEYGSYIQQTDDGGYVIVGFGSSTDNGMTTNGGTDYLIIKIDAQGNQEWVRNYGGSNDDNSYFIEQTRDGGYIVMGNTLSDDQDISLFYGSQDYWIVKLDGQGDITWQSTYGGTGSDYPSMIREVPTGGYIIVGWSNSTDGDLPSNNNGEFDTWVTRLDETGNIQWQRIIGGSERDRGQSVEVLDNGNYLIGGFTRSGDGDLVNNNGEEDYWLLTMEDSGQILWQETFGDRELDKCYDAIQTLDGGFAMIGWSETANNGEDLRIIKLKKPEQADVTVVNDISETICQGANYQVGNNTYTTTGEYTNFFTTEADCDSIVNLDLTVISPSNPGIGLIQELCDDDPLPSFYIPLPSAGETIDWYDTPRGGTPILSGNLRFQPTEGGTYYAETRDLNSGCTSRVRAVIELRINPIEVIEYICITPDVDTTMLQAEVTCENAIVILPRYAPTYEFLNIEAVSSVTDADIDSMLYESIAGCDSLVITDFRFCPDTIRLQETICAGDSYLFGSQTLTESGTYQREEQIEDCTNLYILNLEMIFLTETPEGITQRNCENLAFPTFFLPNLAATETLDWYDAAEGGNLLANDQREFRPSATGIYYAEIRHSASSCVSAERVPFELLILPSDTVQLQASLCTGATYEVGNQSFTSEGDYEILLFNTQGCDSLVQLELRLDDVPPVFSACPEAITVAATSMAGVVVNWDIPSLTENCDTNPSLTASHSPNTIFPIGTTFVQYTATDAAGNTDVCQFAVNVTEGETGTCRFRDSLVLVDIWNALGGENWTYDDTIYTRLLGNGWFEVPRGTVPNAGKVWNFTEPIDTWHGVELNADGCLSSLKLNSNGLSGNMYDFDFPELVYLDFGDNNLTGSIPDFQNLPSLTNLYLYNNSLTGDLHNFDALALLTTLLLQDNSIEGQIPNFDNLPLLTNLDLRRNELSGTLVNFENCPELYVLGVGSNLLSGELPDFSSLSELINLSIQNTNLTGSVIRLENNRELRRLYLGNNNFTGAMIDINQLPDLRTLILSNNQLVGSLIDISGHTSIGYFDIANNRLSGEIPIITDVPNLESFLLAQNSLSGQISNFSSYTDKLVDIDIFDNKFTFESILLHYNDNLNLIMANSSRDNHNYAYAPQDSVYIDTLITAVKTEPLVIDLLIDEVVESNIYQWYKNGQEYRLIEGNNDLIFDNIQLGDAGVYNATIINPNLPDLMLYSRNITLVVELNCTDTESNLTQTICTDESYPLGEESYSESGTYTATLQTTNGCDSTITLNLTVATPSENTLLVNLCEGDTYQGVTYVQDETLTETLTNNTGCDSLLTTQISVEPLYNNISTTSICTGEMVEGIAVFQDTMIVIQGSSIAGCDSITTLNVQVHRSISNAFAWRICEGESYFFDGQDRSESGVFNTTITTANGCDSTTTLTLTVATPSENTLLVNLCEGDTYQGVTYTQDGTLMETLTNTAGCDSILTTQILVVPLYDIVNTTSVCAGEIVEGIPVFQDTMIVFQGSSIAGCDSTTTVNVQVIPSVSNTFAWQICEGESYTLGSQTLTMGGTYSESFQTTEGCDSLVTLNLSVLESITTNITRESCDPAMVGTATEPLISSSGCDSIVNITTTLRTITETILEEDTCDPNAQERRETLQTAEGCDSILVYVPNILITTASTTLPSIYDCNISEATQAVDTLQNVNGCDSLVITPILPGTATETAQTIFICFPEDVRDAERLEYTNVNGCDSIVVTNYVFEVVPISYPTVLTCEDGRVEEQGYSTEGRCDSVVITTYFPYDTDAPTRLTASTCIPDLEPDTTYLPNRFDCDSIIITSWNYQPILATIGETIYTCTQNSAPFDTLILSSYQGCDSMILSPLLAYPTVENTVIDEIVCDEAISGTRTDTLVSVNGCDSLRTTNFIYQAPQEENLTQISCIEAEAGTEVIPIQNQAGCDSIIRTITAIYGASETITVERESCDPEQEATDRAIFENQYGCDSIIIYNYTYVGETDTTFLTARTTCNRDNIGNIVYSYDNQYDCDSIVVEPIIYEALEVISIREESCDIAYLDSVSIRTYINTDGCEQTERTSYRILPPSQPTYYSEPTCIASEVERRDTIWHENRYGCDSLEITTFTYEPLAVIDTSFYICSLIAIERDTMRRITADGCEQIIYQTKIPAEAYSVEIDGIVCSEAEEDIRTEYLMTHLGCDSTVVWNIQYIPPIERIEESTTCIGETRSDTTYYQGIAGCDSLLIIHNVNYEKILEQDIEAQICEGEAYEFNGELLEEAGVYTEIFTSVEGCDSTVNLFLEMTSSELILLDHDTITFAAGSSNFIAFDIQKNDQLPEDDAWQIELLESPYYGTVNFSTDSLLEYRLSTAFQDYIGVDSFRYEICAIDCINNCDTASVYIDVSRECLPEINLPKGWGITPDDPNGLNTSFDPLAELSIECAEHPSKGNAEMLILSKAGEIVYRTKQIGTETYQAWDGYDNNGTRLPDGVYYFILRFTLNGEEVEPLKGWVTLFSSGN